MDATRFDMLLAPAACGYDAPVSLPGRSAPPPIDEHLVRPETREEQVRGRKVVTMPAKPPHGDRHFELDYVIRAHIKPGFVGSTDLLTRLTESSDFATDTCVRREGTDPATGARYLEELAFEIVHEQSRRDITERAEDLTTRGVRRLFAIFVKKGEVHEWSGGAWKQLRADALIHDATLSRPLAVKALLDAAEADNAVARALVEKNNPVIAEVKEEVRAAALQEGARRMLLRQFEKRLGRPASPPERAALEERLERLGADRLEDVVLSFARGDVAAWLADPSAR